MSAKEFIKKKKKTIFHDLSYQNYYKLITYLNCYDECDYVDVIMINDGWQK